MLLKSNLIKFKGKTMAINLKNLTKLKQNTYGAIMLIKQVQLTN